MGLLLRQSLAPTTNRLPSHRASVVFMLETPPSPWGDSSSPLLFLQRCLPHCSFFPSFVLHPDRQADASAYPDATGRLSVPLFLVFLGAHRSEAAFRTLSVQFEWPLVIPCAVLHRP